MSEFGDLAVGMGEVCVMRCYGGHYLGRYSTWSLGREAGTLTHVCFFSFAAVHPWLSLHLGLWHMVVLSGKRAAYIGCDAGTGRGSIKAAIEKWKQWYFVNKDRIMGRSAVHSKSLCLVPDKISDPT